MYVDTQESKSCVRPSVLSTIQTKNLSNNSSKVHRKPSEENFLIKYVGVLKVGQYFAHCTAEMTTGW